VLKRFIPGGAMVNRKRYEEMFAHLQEAIYLKHLNMYSHRLDNVAHWSQLAQQQLTKR